MGQLIKFTKEFVSAMIAGIMISIGGTVYLSVNDPVIGSLLFAVGLFTIVIYQLNLFTGKIGYLITTPLKELLNYVKLLVIIWIGNFTGADLFCRGIYYIKPELDLKATVLCNVKLSQPFWTTIILSIFCGLLMYIAVDNFKNSSSDIGKYIGVFVCVSVFIICKFEHCVADMFYFGMMNGLPDTSWIVIKYLLIVTLGNTLGSFILPIYQKIKGVNKKLNVNNY